MEIIKKLNGKELTLTLKGELNTYTANDLDAVIQKDLKNVDSLIIDMNDLTYLTSAGLRVLLVAQKIMNDKKGSVVVRKVNASIMEIFEITGFVNVLNIEN